MKCQIFLPDVDKKTIHLLTSSFSVIQKQSSGKNKQSNILMKNQRDQKNHA